MPPMAGQKLLLHCKRHLCCDKVVWSFVLVGGVWSFVLVGGVDISMVGGVYFEQISTCRSISVLRAGHEHGWGGIHESD